MIQNIKTYYLEHKLTVAACLAITLLALAALVIFKFPISSLLWPGAILLCPLLHLWMMKDMNHKH